MALKWVMPSIEFLLFCNKYKTRVPVSGTLNTFQWNLKSALLHSIWQSSGPSMLLQMVLFCPFLMTEWYSILCMYLAFFIHSSVDGQLCCFHDLAIVNSIAMNIKVYVSFQIMVFLHIYAQSGIAGSYASSTFNFLRNIHLFSKSIYIPTNSARGFPLLYTFSRTSCV